MAANVNTTQSIIEKILSEIGKNSIHILLIKKTQTMFELNLINNEEKFADQAILNKQLQQMVTK